MTKKFKDAIKSRRTFYQIDNKSTLSEKELLDLIRFAVEYVHFSIQFTNHTCCFINREAHQKLWNIVKILCVSGFLWKLLLKRNRK